MFGKSRVSLFIDGHKYRVPSGKTPQTLEDALALFGRGTPRPCEDGSCGLCRVLLIGWSVHPRPIPIEACQVAWRAKEPCQVFTGKGIRAFYPEIQMVLGRLLRDCSVCSSAMAVSIAGFYLWERTSGVADFGTWASFDVMCWQCCGHSYRWLYEETHLDEAGLARALGLSLGKIAAMPAVFGERDAATDTKKCQAFTMAAHDHLFSGLARPEFDGGPWRFVWRSLRERVTWAQLFTVTWADLLSDALQGKYVQAILDASGAHTGDESIQLPSLIKPRHIVIEIMNFGFGTDLWYVAMGAIRKGHRVAQVRIMLTPDNERLPIRAKAAEAVLEETHINDARAGESVDKVVQACRNGMDLTPIRQLMVRQTVDRIFDRYRPEASVPV